MYVSPWIISFLLPEAAQTHRRIWLLLVSIVTEERAGELLPWILIQVRRYLCSIHVSTFGESTSFGLLIDSTSSA
jgi:hypothetical protein